MKLVGSFLITLFFLSLSVAQGQMVTIIEVPDEPVAMQAGQADEVAEADDTNEADDAEELESASKKKKKSRKKKKQAKEVPEILDVDERDAEMYRFEFTPFAGTFLGDTLQSSFLFGGMLEARLTPSLSLGADFGWSRIGFDPISSFGSTVTNKNLYAIEGFFTVNLPAAFLSRRGVVETDFFTTLGGGVLNINGSMRGAGFIGGGLKMYTGLGWLGFRVEVRNYFSTLSTPNGSDFTTDLTMTFGPTFMLPPKLF